MNYFKIEGGELTIRNHYFPWRRIEIKLGDIVQANREPYHHRRSDGLRIMTTDLRTRIFYAGSLWDGTWDTLLKDLKSVGIKT